jgi:hypothetical protein
MTRITDAQWREFRKRMEEISEAKARGSRSIGIENELLAEMVLLLMDRIDDLEKRIA